MQPHPDNVLPNGEYDPRMYDLAFRKHNGAHRVTRGLGHHIGYVAKEGRYWITLNTRMERFGYAWKTRLLAAHMLSHTVPLPPAGDDARYRVEGGEK